MSSGSCVAHTIATPSLAREPGEEDGDRDRVLLVEARGRLVHEDQPGAGGECAGDRDPAPLAGREPRDALGDALRQADLGERLDRAVAVRVVQRLAELDVLARAQERRQPGLLADEGDRARTQLGAGGAVEPGEDGSVARRCRRSREARARRADGGAWSCRIPNGPVTAVSVPPRKDASRSRSTSRRP